MKKIEVLGIAIGTIIMPDGNSYQDAVFLSTKKTTVNGPDPIFEHSISPWREISKQFCLPGYLIPSIEVLHAIIQIQV